MGNALQKRRVGERVKLRGFQIGIAKEEMGVGKRVEIMVKLTCRLCSVHVDLYSVLDKVLVWSS